MDQSIKQSRLIDTDLAVQKLLRLSGAKEKKESYKRVP
jgi:hypothetical protein